MELIAKEDVIVGLGNVSVYRNRILPYIEKFRNSIEYGGGKTEIKIREIREILGWEEYKHKSDNTIYSRIKDILLEYGINVSIHHHYGANLILTFVSNESEIKSAKDVGRERLEKTARNAGFLKYGDYRKTVPSYRNTRPMRMDDKRSLYYFVNIGKNFVAPVLFPGAIINEYSLGKLRFHDGGYDWTYKGLKVKHLSSILKHRIDEDNFERDVFQWRINRNEKADIFVLTGWGSRENLDLMKAWIVDAKEIVNNKEFFDRMSFVVSTHDRSIKKYSKFEVDEQLLDEIREKIVLRNGKVNLVYKDSDIRSELKEWYKTYFR